jgi:hypothetical protein
MALDPDRHSGRIPHGRNNIHCYRTWPQTHSASRSKLARSNASDSARLTARGGLRSCQVRRIESNDVGDDLTESVRIGKQPAVRAIDRHVVRVAQGGAQRLCCSGGNHIVPLAPYDSDGQPARFNSSSSPSRSALRAIDAARHTARGLRAMFGIASRRITGSTSVTGRLGTRSACRCRPQSHRGRCRIATTTPLPLVHAEPPIELTNTKRATCPGKSCAVWIATPAPTPAFL